MAKREIEVHLEVGQEIAYYWGSSRTPVKRKITKVRADGRFYFEGNDNQWTPQKHYHGPHAWSATARSEQFRSNVLPWDEEVEKNLADLKREVLNRQKITAIKAKVEKLHYTQEDLLDKLISLLEINL